MTKILYQKHIFIFIGPEGAGKSTQAKLLAEELDLPYISTGDMLRKFAREDHGHLGDASRHMFAENGYLDATLINEIIATTLQDTFYTGGVVLDGSLRTYEETLHFDDAIKNAGLALPITVFYLDIPQEESIRRLQFGRGREDDTIQGILARLRHFHDRLQDRLAIIAKRYKLITINGMQSKERVHDSIMSTIQQLSSWKEANAD